MSTTIPRVDVLGVGVSATSVASALDEIQRWVDEDEQHYVCVTGVHGVMESQRDRELMQIHNESGLTIPDGAPILWCGRYAGSSEIERMRGSDFMWDVTARAAERGWRCFFYGGAEGTPELLAERLTARFPGLQVAGTYSPPFRPLTPDEETDVVDMINASGADIVWVGLSTPKQERFMRAAMGRVRAPVLAGVGMAFDVHAGLLPQAPKLIQRSGFEWLYRLVNEPRRLWRRYFENNPRFVLGVLRRRPFLRPGGDATAAAAAIAQTPSSSRAKQALHRLFLGAERLRVHILPRHFYSSVADRGWLRANPELWRHELPMAGIAWDLDAQAAWLDDVCREHLPEVAGFSFLTEMDERGVGFRYGLIEGQVLHCVLRGLRPPRVVEVGSGASTVISAAALARNRAEGAEGALVSIDPYAPAELEDLDGAEIRREPAQTADAAIFAELRAGDVLFIDTTHVVKTGSEVTRLYLDVLPKLAPGVIVHIHDIYLPYPYSPWILADMWDWQETVLLAALLTDNPRFEVLACQSALHAARPERLAATLPDYRPRRLEDGIDEGGEGHFPSSIWLRTR